MKVLVIIPAYNEELSIKKTVDNLKKCIDKSKYDIDYVIINDGSCDNTYDIIKENNFNAINLINNLGIGGAVQTGYKYAYSNNYDIAIQFDGDGQHDEKYIDKLIDKIEEGNDFVIGSRFIENLSKFKSTKTRQIGIKIISAFIKFTTKTKIYDPTSGYRAANRSVIKYFTKKYPQEYPEPESTVELLCNNYEVCEMPVNMRKRKSGKSSIYLHKNIYYMISVCLSILLNKFRRKKNES